MAAMDPIPVEVTATCRRCDEEVRVMGRMELAQLDTISDPDGNHAKVLYKAEVKMSTEVHVCSGEKTVKEPSAWQLDVLREYWTTGPGAQRIMSGNDARKSLGLQAKKKVLIIGQTLSNVRDIEEANKDLLDRCDVMRFSLEMDATRLRGPQWHVAIWQRRAFRDAPLEMRKSVDLGVRLGDTPTIHYVEPGEKLDKL